MKQLYFTARRFAGRIKKHVLKLANQGRTHDRLRSIAALPDVSTVAGHILFFTPEAAVVPHFAAQCILARTMKELGHQILMVRCFDLFRRCPVMDMLQVPDDIGGKARQKVCLDCAGDSFRMCDSYGLESVDLRALDNLEIRSTVTDALGAAPHDLREFTFDSVPFGQFCLMDLVLAKKIVDFENMPALIRQAWLNYLESSLLSYLLIDKLCKQLQPGRLVHYNDYALLLGAHMAAKKNHVPVFSVTSPGHRNIDRSRFIIVPEAHAISMHRQGKMWPQWRQLPLCRSQVRESGADSLFRLAGVGSHIFSPPKTTDLQVIRANLGLVHSEKLLVAYTSSFDERIAADTHLAAMGFNRSIVRQPFTDQTEWLDALVHFVESQKGLRLVVRVHPREGTRKGNKVASQYLARLQARFSGAFSRCCFFWPNDPVSSYDLGELADLALISWSTLGVELARLGVPVLSATNGIGPFPIDDFIEWADTPDTYFAKLHTLLNQSASLDTITRAHRWYNLYKLANTLDLGDVVPASDYLGLPSFRLAKEAKTIEKIIMGKQDILEINLSRLQASQRPESSVEERQAVQQELRRVLWYLFTNENREDDYDLVLAAKPVQGCRHQDPRLKGGRKGQTKILFHDGCRMDLHDGTRTWSRSSPMANRLASLCAQTIIGSC